MSHVDIGVEEVNPEQGVKIAKKFVEDAVETLRDPNLKAHDIEHAIFDLKTALAYLA